MVDRCDKEGDTEGEPGAPRRTVAWPPLRAWLDNGDLPRIQPHPCPYLPGLQASERAFLADAVDPEAYHELMDRGFRRSGTMFYAMDCAGCRRCVPIRIPVAEFVPSRSQRRALHKNGDVHMHVRTPEFTASTWQIYRRYLRHQHGTVQGDETPESFRATLYEQVVSTVEVTYTIGERLVAVSLLDVCSRSVSAVYHFYEPEFAHRSLGVFSVLTEIAWTRQLGVPHYYLGYWVEGAETMQYKANYRPHELLRAGVWQQA